MQLHEPYAKARMALFSTDIYLLNLKYLSVAWIIPNLMISIPLSIINSTTIQSCDLDISLGVLFLLSP